MICLHNSSLLRLTVDAHCAEEIRLLRQPGITVPSLSLFIHTSINSTTATESWEASLKCSLRPTTYVHGCAAQKHHPKKSGRGRLLANVPLPALLGGLMARRSLRARFSGLAEASTHTIFGRHASIVQKSFSQSMVTLS